MGKVPSPTRHAMPAADAAWLHMERRTNPMVINSVVMLGRTPSYEAVLARLEERLIARFPRFRQRVVDPRGRRAAFEDDPGFDLEGHVHRRALPSPGDREALELLVGDLITAPLDPNRPLWHAYLIETDGEGAALLWRIHHCIADGIALSRALLSITDDSHADDSPVSPAPGRGLLGRLASLPGRAASAAVRAGGVGIHEGMEALAHPDHLRELAGAALRDASTAARLIAAPADAPSALRPPLSGTRRVAWSEPVSLDRVREACHRRRVTINDMLVAALAAALGAGFAGSPGLPDAIHAMVPFNLRPLDDPVPAELGNDFALILLELPVGPMAPAERLREVASRMEAIKRSREAPIA